ncbi:universal stress protein [Parasulfitobacter algicola]|uniref:Universal stress protein n=1 Tax=Parasulfitobacter algicola TaxID=2614809 RepID=A0ABX2IRV5_9RHOB|nr:universal stress protein [Sulfitobacter algicola]NSX55634.1 universal stress protein [Sulfitobacter algicola]
MIKHIMATTDLSARSDRAVRRAIKLAQTQQAKLTVLCVLDNAMPDDMLDPLVGKARTTLERLIAGAVQDTPLDHDIIIQQGDPTTEILQTTVNTNADLLVMGIHRPRPFFDSLRETTVQRIVRQTDCPVLMVKDAADHDYEKIVSAVDFSPASTAAIQLAHTLSPQAIIETLHVVHVPYQGRLATGDQSAEALAAAFINEARQNEKTWRGRESLPDTMKPVEIVQGSVYPALCNMVLHSDAHLICVGAHGRMGTLRAVLGSVANDLMRDAPCDILIARPRQGQSE